MSIRSKLMIEAAECTLSDVRANHKADCLFAIAPNPFEQGRKNQLAAWRAYWRERSRPLVWC